MSLAQALSVAGSALRASSAQISVASNNIANALTPGFNRRDATLAERAFGGGVSVVAVARAQAPAIAAERRLAEGQAAFDGRALRAAEDIFAAVGETESANALLSRLNAFEVRLRTLADDPGSEGAQGATLAAATSLAGAYNDNAGRLQALRIASDADIAREIDAVRAAVVEIDRLNRRIAQAGVAGADAAALFDERARQIEAVNRIIPVRELVRDNEQVELVTHEGVFLLADRPRRIDFAPAGQFGADASLANGALSGLTIDGVDVTRGASRQAIAGGLLAAAFSVRDEAAPAAAQRLDALAKDLVDRFAAPGLDPTLAPGAPGLFIDAGGPAGDPPTGLAARLAVNAAVDPSVGGALFRLRDGIGAGAPGPAGQDGLVRGYIGALAAPRPAPGIGTDRAVTAAEATAQIASLAGAALTERTSARDASEAARLALSEAELGATGVDIDRELQSLLAIEQAYAANARIIAAVDRMLGELLEI